MARLHFLLTERQHLFKLGEVLLDIAAASGRKKFLISADGTHGSGKTAIFDGMLQHAGIDKDYGVSQPYRSDEEYELNTPHGAIDKITLSTDGRGKKFSKSRGLEFAAKSNFTNADIKVIIEGKTANMYMGSSPLEHLGESLCAPAREAFRGHKLLEMLEEYLDRDLYIKALRLFSLDTEIDEDIRQQLDISRECLPAHVQAAVTSAGYGSISECILTEFKNLQDTRFNRIIRIDLSDSLLKNPKVAAILEKSGLMFLPGDYLTGRSTAPIQTKAGKAFEDSTMSATPLRLSALFAAIGDAFSPSIVEPPLVFNF
ncbi:MAG: hypothetical protein GC136_00710 [Alphaproteobacteria bacterium]|nr:hypothetical protein [Alphaproteobacteria bacterium]